MFFPIMAWTLWITHRDRTMWRRALAIVALTYALTAFWLTPSYMRITAENLKLVALPGNWSSRAIASVFALLFCWVTWRVARGRKQLAWRVFLFGALAWFALSVLGQYYFGFRVVGEPARYVPEFDLLMIAGAVECLRMRPRAAKLCGAFFLVVPLGLAHGYLRSPWSVYVVDPKPHDRIEYRLTEWIAQHLPGSRVFATGSLRLWYSAWRDVAEAPGGSDQGMQNQMVALAQWQITVGDRPERDIYWLQALGTDAIVVHGKRSQEFYHHIGKPGKYAGRLAVLYDSGQDDIIYRVPRRFPGLARVVDRRRMEALPEIGWHDYNSDQLRAYAEALEQGPDSPAASQWLSTRAMRIRARVGPGESITVQESYDPAWKAWSGGRQFPIRKDVMGFMRIDAPPGEHDIRLEFETPLENQIGRLLTAAALIAVAGLWVRALR